MKVSELTKQYDGKTVVNGVSFEIPKGKVLSLIGPNGAGKSTVMGIISRLIARDAGLVLLNVPYAAVGGILALLITNFNFSISAGIGFIALFGICIQNGVIMISDIKNNLRERHPLEDSIKMSVKSRVRSVLMTASMAAIGLLPAALSHGIGSESQRPLAIVIIGGLIGAMFFTLFVFPLMVEAFYRRMLYDKNGKLVQRRL